MRTVESVYNDVVVQVRAEANSGEHVFISGNTPELGEWKVSKAVMLSKLSTDSNIWGGVIRAAVDQIVQYRYLTCVIVENDGKQENVVRHWESHLCPRVLRPYECTDGKSELNVFGYHDDTESISSGWLTSETVVQLKMFNSSIAIWKRRYREKPISYHVSTIDITRKEADISPEEDSTLTEFIGRGWPIVEVAVMNETGWQFHQQSQFGIIYDPTDYVMFQAQMMEPDTIDVLSQAVYRDLES